MAHTCKWVLACRWMSHGKQIKDYPLHPFTDLPSHTCASITSHMQMSHGTHANESRHMNDSCHTACHAVPCVKISVCVWVWVWAWVWVWVWMCVCVRVCVSRCMRSDIFWYFSTHVHQSYKSCERVASHVHYFTRVLLQTASVANSPTTPYSTHDVTTLPCVHSRINKWMSHYTHVSESWHTCQLGTTHMWMSHEWVITHMDKLSANKHNKHLAVYVGRSPPPKKTTHSLKRNQMHW